MPVLHNPFTYLTQHTRFIPLLVLEKG